MNTLKERVIELLAKHKRINTHMFDDKYNDRSRQVRNILSELRNEGNIYIPITKSFYIHESVATQEQIETYYYSQTKHLSTQYFNTVKPLGKLVKDNKLTELMGTLDEAFSKEI